MIVSARQSVSCEQTFLAEKSRISAAYLSQIEGGQRDGSFETMRRIAKALQVSLDDLA